MNLLVGFVLLVVGPTTMLDAFNLVVGTGDMKGVVGLLTGNF